ncbi:MAG: hypothetical protein NXI20_14655 [bacterium]|nr:hypothetical protein [bacterium]
MAKFKKDYRDYLLFLGGVILNFYAGGVIADQFDDGTIMTWVIFLSVALSLSTLMYFRWAKTFTIHTIKNDNSEDDNFKICHEVIKSFQHKIIDNNQLEKKVYVMFKLLGLPSYTTFYCEKDLIMFNSVPAFNFWLFLFIPTRTKSLIQEIKNLQTQEL